MNRDPQAEAFSSLVTSGLMAAADMEDCIAAAASRGVPLARILHGEYGVPREDLLAALRSHYRCRSVEYDERLPVPPGLLLRLRDADPVAEGWFPVMQRDDGTVVIAAVDPAAPGLMEAVSRRLGAGDYEIRVALPDDIAWFAQDFLHAPPGELIGTERTGLAYWRNTMAQWRTRMACYRTDMARARTALSAGRAGLACVTIAETLWRANLVHARFWMPLAVFGVGMVLLLVAAPVYLKVRQSRLTPPGNQTLVEVTAATLTFLEDFHYPAPPGHRSGPSKETMLARLGDLLADYSTIIYPVPASRERTHLARERNVLAAQRTIAACYRTIYSRARTGLAFIRTGASFISIGVGLMTYYGMGVNLPFDLILVLVGGAFIVDGLLWYLPVRREQAGLPRSRSAVLAGEGTAGA